MYYLLTENFKEQEKLLVELISKTVAVESIYMLGSTLKQRRTESIFLVDAPSCRVAGHYYLLVLINKNIGHSFNEIQDRIENSCRSFVPVTAIILDTEQFYKWLCEGHPFAETVVKIAVLLHGSNNFKPAEKTTKQIIQKENNEGFFAEQYNKVNEFIEGGKLFLLRQQNKMSIFMLHQAVEHALRTIFKKLSGLHINTHNLDKLFRYCAMVSYQVPDIFNFNNENEKRLFRLLQEAYINTRYKDNFIVTKEDLANLLEKVKRLQIIMINIKKS